ncbi:MAG: hypothetical protein E6K53_11640 [Gammaproteobacteria bacterium]|nr:MAG: hypothetical protein E6K53_11640 [Gammaproteobacteria bacterium]
MALEKMPDKRLAIDRLRWTQDFYFRDPTPAYAYYDDAVIAYLADCPKGRALRMYSIPSGEPGATQIFETHAEAMKAVEDWVRGPDIDPGPDVTFE